jgi:hypothetical protein
MPGPTIDQLLLADDPNAWEELGFEISRSATAAECRLGTVRVGFTAGASEDATVDRPSARGLVGWVLRDAASAELDGLPTTVSTEPLGEPAGAHPNGVTAIDHVVAMTPAFERSVHALQEAGLDLRRIREEPTPAGAPRQAFFRLGAEILELVQVPEEALARSGGSDGPAFFWGLALLSEDIDRTAARMAPHVSEVRQAVQAGRKIATVRRSAGLAVPLALMSAKVNDSETEKEVA